MESQGRLPGGGGGAIREDFQEEAIFSGSCKVGSNFLDMRGGRMSGWGEGKVAFEGL